MVLSLKKIKRKNKRAALELSIGTIVILVLAMSMLILGLILVRTIFSGATGTVEQLDESVKEEIKNIFVKEDELVLVKLGAEKTAEVPADGDTHNVAFGARTIDGTTVDIREFKYKLSIDNNARDNCVSRIGERVVEHFLIQPVGTRIAFDEFEGDKAYALVEISIPEGTLLCTQKFFIDVEDRGKPLGRDVFKIEIVRKGFF
tara:strand:- start:281 stop:889 length:609 start_codon:yes stop_codon:yes gene_type:complete